MGSLIGLVAKIFGFVLNFIYGIVKNYGISIIIFTILLRLVLLPMNIKQQKTMKKTAKIQAKTKEIQDKYSSDPTRMNQEIMELYKTEKMSPFSGCLSSIFQFIVLIGMFYLVSRPLTYMLNFDTQTINDYTSQVQEAEGDNAKRYIEISIIRYLAKTDHPIDLNMNFLGLDLSSVPTQDYSDWKVFIIPVLYVITSITSMKLTTKLNSNKKKEDKKEEVKTNLPKKVDDNMDNQEMMEQMTKNMSIMMPIMTVSIAIIAPLGLALYWFVSNLLSIFERLVIYKFVKDEKEEV